MPLKTAKREEAGVLVDLSVLEGLPCAGCARPLCGHHALAALVMGFKSAPRCARCIAGALDQPYGDFLDRLVELVHHRDCYHSGWKWADRRENVAGGRRPPCLGVEGDEAQRKPRKEVPTPIPTPPPGEEWDAGSMGCGDLVLELRLRLARLAPGAELRVLARDPGAPEDIPAWCRLTGHSLVEANPPLYRIRRKES